LVALVKEVRRIEDTDRDVIDRDELFLVAQAIQFRNFELMARICNERGFTPFRSIYDERAARMWPLEDKRSAYATLDRFDKTRGQSIYRNIHFDKGEHLYRWGRPA
jgi:hypothetical protein